MHDILNIMSGLYRARNAITIVFLIDSLGVYLINLIQISILWLKLYAKYSHNRSLKVLKNDK
ncbi:hypothetical protein D770_26780 [Flammeovirgaceae bacterium 311]|nr:hypothetical protein D770_26780 [Flammeovirgaceae bacterium 311]